MIWEERILYFSAFQFLYVIPENTSLFDVEVPSLEVGSGFQEYVHWFGAAYAVFAWITKEVIRQTIKWLGSDTNGFLSIVQHHGVITIKVSYLLNQRLGKVSGLLIWSPCGLFPMPCHLPVKSSNTSPESRVR